MDAMSNPVKLVLPEPLVALAELPRLMAEARRVSMTADMGEPPDFSTIEAEAQYRQLLLTAARKGAITPLDPQSLVPTDPQGGRWSIAVIKRSDLTNYIAAFGFEVITATETEQTSVDSEQLPIVLGHRNASAVDSQHWIDRKAIFHAFKVRPDEDENERFWEHRLEKPSKNLAPARAMKGKPGQSHRWNPLLFAHGVLADGHMPLFQLDQVFKKLFPKLEERWHEETEDKRS